MRNKRPRTTMKRLFNLMIVAALIMEVLRPIIIGKIHIALAAAVFCLLAAALVVMAAVAMNNQKPHSTTPPNSSRNWRTFNGKA